MISVWISFIGIGLVMVAAMSGFIVPGHVEKDRAVVPAPKALPKYVPFDKDWAAIGAIEPVIEEKLVGYYNERLVLDDDPIVAMSYASDVPIYLKSHKEAIEPIPRYEKQLRWKPVQETP